MAVIVWKVMEKVFKLVLRMPNFAVLLPLTMRIKCDKVPVNQRKKNFEAFLLLFIGADLRKYKAGSSILRAEGAIIQAPWGPKGVGSEEGDYPLPSLLGSLGNRRKFPQCGLGRSPTAGGFFVTQ